MMFGLMDKMMGIVKIFRTYYVTSPEQTSIAEVSKETLKSPILRAMTTATVSRKRKNPRQHSHFKNFFLSFFMLLWIKTFLWLLVKKAVGYHDRYHRIVIMTIFARIGKNWQNRVLLSEQLLKDHIFITYLNSRCMAKTMKSRSKLVDGLYLSLFVASTAKAAWWNLQSSMPIQNSFLLCLSSTSMAA